MKQMPIETTINGITVTIERPEYGEVSFYHNGREFTRTLPRFLSDGNVMDEHDSILKIREDIVACVQAWAENNGFIV